MPTYEAKCDKCEAITEYHVSFKEMDSGIPKQCPACKEEGTLKRIFPTAASTVVFKGPGWYKTGGY